MRPTAPGHPGVSNAGLRSVGRVLVDGIAAPDLVAEIDPTRGAAARRLPERIAFLGFGLIGGSIALAIREAGSAANLAAWSPTGGGPAEALRRAAIDEAAASAEAALDGADLVVLGGPPQAVAAALQDADGAVRQRLVDGATLTDVASTKGHVVGLAEAAGLPFVGGHPMAGREKTGFANAVATLFVDRPWVVVPSRSARELDVDRVAALAGAVGARPIRMTAAEHDAAVAAISHLPLVAAAALVEAVALSSDGAADWPVAMALAATGWSDMTRLARGDPDMGAGILVTNRAAVAARLRAYRDAIDAWLRELGSDPGEPTAVDQIRSRLEAARDAIDSTPSGDPIR